MGGPRPADGTRREGRRPEAAAAGAGEALFFPRTPVLRAADRRPRMLDLEEARIERETSKMDFRRLCEQVHFFSRRSQKNPEDTMPSASLLRSSRTLPPVTFSPRRATTRFSRHPVRAFKEGARCFVLLRELAIRERAGGDDAATGQKRGFHVFFSPLGHVSLSLSLLRRERPPSTEPLFPCASMHAHLMSTACF